MEIKHAPLPAGGNNFRAPGGGNTCARDVRVGDGKRDEDRDGGVML